MKSLICFNNVLNFCWCDFASFWFQVFVCYVLHCIVVHIILIYMMFAYVLWYDRCCNVLFLVCVIMLVLPRNVPSMICKFLLWFDFWYYVLVLWYSHYACLRWYDEFCMSHFDSFCCSIWVTLYRMISVKQSDVFCCETS